LYEKKYLHLLSAAESSLPVKKIAAKTTAKTDSKTDDKTAGGKSPARNARVEKTPTKTAAVGKFPGMGKSPAGRKPPAVTPVIKKAPAGSPTMRVFSESPPRMRRPMRQPSTAVREEEVDDRSIINKVLCYSLVVVGLAIAYFFYQVRQWGGWGSPQVTGNFYSLYPMHTLHVAVHLPS